MILNETQRMEFEAAVRPLIKFINNHCHSHVIVNVDSTHAELLEGICSFNTNDYLKDNLRERLEELTGGKDNG